MIIFKPDSELTLDEILELRIELEDYRDGFRQPQDDLPIRQGGDK